MKYLLILSFIFSFYFFDLTAQVPDPAFNPMTANGARHISYYNGQWAHILYWQNPTNLIYNDVYVSQDSNLVINLDPSVKVLSGIDSSKVFSSLSLEVLGVIDLHTKYYWRVVEHNTTGFTAGPVWYFYSQSSSYNYWEDDFNNNLSNYTKIEPYPTFWDIWPSNFAGGSPSELRYDSHYNISPVPTYLVLNEIFDLSPSINPLSFNHCFQLYYGEFIIGLAYSLDEGITWIPFWQQNVTSNIPPTQVWYVNVPNENYVKLSLFSKSLHNPSMGYWYVDNLLLNTPLTVSIPPSQIFAQSDTSVLKINLTWRPGGTVNPSWGYRLQRKNGLPRSSSSYSTIAEVGPGVLAFEDINVQLDSIYTYRIQSKEGPGGGWVTTWSNEATAYVPAIVPVELLSFSSSVVDDDVTLNWATATETNNSGFQIERKSPSPTPSLREGTFDDWESIGFVNGYGTTTEPQTYSFIDKNLSAGNYQYRLKQIDFDGTYEYSNTIEVEINPPTQFSLEQNYPNPFNPTTTIRFTIPSVETHLPAGRQGRDASLLTTLKVFDVLGNEVATLVNEVKPAGNYDVEFDASKLSSGIYYYQLKSENFVQTKKMILMK